MRGKRTLVALAITIGAVILANPICVFGQEPIPGPMPRELKFVFEDFRVTSQSLETGQERLILETLDGNHTIFTEIEILRFDCPNELDKRIVHAKGKIAYEGIAAQNQPGKALSNIEFNWLWNKKSSGMVTGEIQPLKRLLDLADLLADETPFLTRGDDGTTSWNPGLLFHVRREAATILGQRLMFYLLFGLSTNSYHVGRDDFFHPESAAYSCDLGLSIVSVECETLDCGGGEKYRVCSGPQPNGDEVCDKDGAGAMCCDPNRGYSGAFCGVGCIGETGTATCKEL